MNLTKLALKRPVSAVLIILALTVFGLSSIMGFNLELQPDMEMPMLLVMTTYPGADPESVEKLVTKEVENAGSILSGVETIQSSSAENVSMVMFSYDYGVDIDECYMDMRAALDAVRASLPDDAGDPIVMQLNMDASDIVTVSATAVGDIDLLKVIEDIIVPEFERISGVADVTVSGGTEDYIQIVLREDMLKQYGLTMGNIAQYISAVDFSMPAGTVTQGSQDVSISTSMEYNTVRKLQTVPILTGTGSVIQLLDVAEVSQSTKEAGSISRYDGYNNVNIGVQKKQSYGTVNVVSDVEKVIKRLNEEEPSLQMKTIYNASETIIASLTSVGSTLILGILFSMVILLLFFGDFKASLIVGSAMPISLFATLILMNAMGFSLNVVTMGALVIAIGMMVDSSIVVIESCFRVKEENPERTFEVAAYIGAKTVASSIIASTITTIVVYFPLSTMAGLSGQMFSQLGFTIIFAMLASLISALTLVPLFYFKFRPLEKKEISANRILEKITSVYTKVLSKILNKKKTVVAISVLLLIGAFALLALINVELMPATDEGIVNINATFRSGTSLDVMNQEMTQLEELVKSHEDVENYSINIKSNSTASITAYLKDDRQAETYQVVEQWNEDTVSITNMDLKIASGSMMMMGSGNAEVNLRGLDIEDLKVASKQLEAVMHNTPGVIKVTSTASETTTKANVIVDPLKSMAVGLTPIQVATTLNNILSGQKALTITNSGEEYEVRLEYPKGVYDSMNGLQNVSLSTPHGSHVPLMDIASIQYTDAPESIMRVDGLYQITVSAAATEQAKFSAPKEINAAIGSISFPEGVGLAESSMTEMMNEEFMALGMAILTAIFLVFLVMAMQFESPRFSMMVMMCIPFSLIGSFLLLFVSGSTLSMPSLMGFLMLVGIVVNNGILYVDTTNQLKSEMTVEEALIKTGGLRLRPILMTTLTTILSMVPMGLGIGENGALMQGMALVIIGGLVASTVLTLILLPTIYLIIEDTKRARRNKKKIEKGQKKQIREEKGLEGAVQEDIGEEENEAKTTEEENS